ncbi:MAG: HlyD family efflux transporter periplasmic adaptor subunit, partial [Clostridiales bacterium]|nr:HlyD family efflux transporter periplasmic adaptor subunit [Clostridiales bacterium]
WESAVFAFQNAGPNEDRPALAAAADAAKSSYDNAYDFYTDAQRAYDTAASMVKDAQDKVDTCQKKIDDIDSEISEAKIELANARAVADAWKDKVAAAQTACDEAEKAYEDAKQAQAKRQADISNAYTKYQEASNAYSKASKDLTVLQNSVDQLKARIAVEESNLTKKETELLQKFNTTKDTILEQLDQEIAENKQIIEEAVILSTMDGVISGINIAKGDAVEQGTTVCDIEYDSNTEQKVICYVPAAEAGKLKTGMSVDIVVSGFDEKEYGHLEGTVQNIAKSGSSQDKVAVTIALRADSDTVSGFWWSANNGASVTIADGTAVTAEFIAKG